MRLLGSNKFVKDVSCAVLLVKRHERCDHTEENLSTCKYTLLQTCLLVFCRHLGPATNVQLTTRIQQNTRSLQIWVNYGWF